ncbi:MAG: hypothetical protein IIZ39_11395 [Blautia sp.]|nr:hypothetical protein [Blautia sp.]
MDTIKPRFPSTEAEEMYTNAAVNYKEDLRKLLKSTQDYKPGRSSNKLSEISALMGKRKKESTDAFDKFTEEVIAEINEGELIQQEKLLDSKRGDASQ